MKTIAIIGGGFGGTMTAVNLSRLSDQPLRVVIINSKRPLGRGTAYGTRRNEHLLNVAARNMSALPDRPTHFVDWLRSRSEFNDTPEDELREMFAPRCIYGDYLRSLLGACMNPIDERSQVTIEALDDEAVDVDVSGESSATVLMKSGDALEADRVVLATGNQAPGSFPSASPLRYDPRYRSDPWSEWLSRLPPPGGTIVLLGTGLTMVDIVLTLGEIGWNGKIVAVSRSGRLPKSHFRGIAYEDFVPDDAESLGLSGLRELVQRHCERLRQMSQNPAIAIDKLRPHTQRLWQSLSKDEKEAFLSHDAPEWNVTRHRIAASIHNRMTDALDSGRLQVIAGTIDKLVPGEQQIDVVLRDTKGNEQSIAGDLIINCTGPQLRFTQAGVPLFDNLLRKQLVTADELDMGILVDKHFAAITGNGMPSPVLFAIGPLLRGSLWETTAVPELRGQAMRVAEAMLERKPVAVQEEEVIEYYI
ncbi:MAG: FAD/NAD(P)-binding protein [Planctomycetaceae bacterium]|nr:FAD/NAD(P)-binding protein [Planctomycetales bacterium]MCB9922638.1 FAD/NAD(P)-binding protein [Planctomycetaceae bacterium]